MKNRFSIWKFNYRDIERKSNRRLGKKEEDWKMGIGNWAVLIVPFVLIELKPIPDSVPYAEWISLLIALIVLFVVLFLRFRRQAPRTCWRNATWALAMWASVITVAPLLLYWFKEFPLDLTWQIIAASSVLWLATLGCYLRLRYIRRRSQEIVLRLRLERKRRKAQYL